MTFEQYKQGVKKELAKNDSALTIVLYNNKVNKNCEFKVRVGDLVANIEKINQMKDSIVGATVRLSKGCFGDALGKNFMGALTVAITHNALNLHKPIVEELAKFRVDHNTELVDGTTLKDNTYIKNDYGRTRIHLMPETKVNDIIVKLDLTEQYMTYPIFLKALLNCDIIDQKEQTLNK